MRAFSRNAFNINVNFSRPLVLLWFPPRLRRPNIKRPVKVRDGWKEINFQEAVFGLLQLPLFRGPLPLTAQNARGLSLALRVDLVDSWGNSINTSLMSSDKRTPHYMAVPSGSQDRALAIFQDMRWQLTLAPPNFLSLQYCTDLIHCICSHCFKGNTRSSHNCRLLC